MEFLRIGEKGHETPVVHAGDKHYDISSIGDIDGKFWAEGPARVAAALESGSLPVIDVAGQRIGAPIAAAGSVICIGQNYAEHAAESGDNPPESPIIFFKTPNTVTGPYDAVGIPPQAQKFDWEVELCVVIGKQVEYLTNTDDALDAIAGYMVANDLSERDYQQTYSGGQWAKGKCVKDSMPVGPVLVTADAIDPHNLNLSSRVNGEPRQGSNTSDMIFPVEEIVYHLSQFMQLEPGDIISTGTPKGVALSGKFPFLAPGDVSEVEVEGLGAQKQEYFQVTVPAGAGAVTAMDRLKGDK
ncbi:fumarylacetoacetate hydrolase family protein [Brevibacterium sp. 91QC2O2]|uniref:fumarylacetoacetate hydrolase family protein n=1 Tax=Brevibacterium sp. 91QC2O2 TaxID=2968458 RepID=UPI00211D1328|nr:fumarylacetoacetate hydrolase family protein [Brevibacterium sp. 91QC2O2]MCQ9367119.1 fumarylacetoacetate hydrolase family protein [Brevibacterium sp. 91QC2O2]